MWYTDILKTLKGVTDQLLITQKPLLPIVFNGAMDSLFCLLDQEGSSYDLEGTVC